MVKAVAEARGLEHRGHRDLHRVIEVLLEETGDNELGTWFDSANSLHINFYENRSGQIMVARGIDNVERFVAKMEAVLSA